MKLRPSLRVDDKYQMALQDKITDALQKYPARHRLLVSSDVSAPNLRAFKEEDEEAGSCAIGGAKIGAQEPTTSNA